jgi:hypothetical protein
MAEFFFFTEPSKLSDQTASQAFSAIDQDQFRVGNMFSITEDARAFAITDGLVLVQQIGTTGRYNLILKPSEQPDLNLPKINYIIYKGIKASSIIDGNKVAASTNNDLTRVIHDNVVQWYAAEGTAIPSTEPAANTSLGLEYTASNPDPDFALQDGDRLDQVFYSSDAITLPFVFGGNYIGDFDSSGEIGLTIVFEKIGFHPTFELARSLTDILSFTPLGGSPTNAEIFRRKHEKETVHNFMDAAAFFGAFTNSRLKVFDGSGFANKSGDVLYNDVISKHFNKNTIYIDIRNESEDSFNYYENYANTLQWSLDGTDTLTNVDYYRNNGWPLLIIDDSVASSEFDTGNLNRTIKLSFPRGDNEFPLIYYRRAYKADLGIQLPTGPEQFYSPSVINDAFTSADLIPYTVNNRASADYFQIKIIRRIDFHEDPSDNFTVLGYSINTSCYLDGLFPIFDLNIPFDDSTGKNLSKLYFNANHINKENINGAEFSANVGVARDTVYRTFFSYPREYFKNIRQNVDNNIPLSGWEGNVGIPFLMDLDNRIRSIKLVKSKFVIGGTDIEYLKFEKSEEDLGGNESYGFNDFAVLSMTNQQYQDLQQLKTQEFPNGLKVSLGIDNIAVGTDDNNNTYTRFDYVLHGLKEDSNNDIIRHKIAPSPAITVYTNEKIIGFPYERNYEEAIGYDNFQDAQQTVRYEDYLIKEQSEIESLVSNFIFELDNIDTASEALYEQIRALVGVTGKSLWNTAVTVIQANPNDPDDRPLYWARLKIAVAIKNHAYFLEDLDANSNVIPGTDLDQTIQLFEETSRNYSGVNFANTPAGAKKILVTGFDPFFLDPDSSGNIEQSNPSGASVLALHGTTTSNNLGYFQAMMIPVRYQDFDQSLEDNTGQGLGIVEEIVLPWINQVDMIVTISQSLPGDYNIDRYATVTRGGLRDNLNHTRIAFSDSIAISDPILEWIETNLPQEFIVPPVEYDFAYFDSNNIEILNDNGSEPPVVGEKMNRGPGGNYLSNEIFYRVAKLRVEQQPSLATGHFHISQLQTPSNPSYNGLATRDLIINVKNAMNNGVTGL